MRFLISCAALALTLLFTATAAATPVATSEGEYSALGRVFPDPLAGCQGGGEKSGCSPYAQGNVPATQFVGVDEFVDAMEFMNTSDRGWSRYMEVLPLDGKKGDGGGTQLGDEMFPGNNLGDVEFTPNPKFQSAGLATTGGGKKKSDVYVVRVTDETVPDAGKKRYALSLSIHGIERAGIEGGTRTIEDLVTAATTPSGEGRTRLDDGVLPGEFAKAGPTFRDVLSKTIVYFTFPNPDGWRRGSVSAFPEGGGAFFQRYNGNGVDLNRDWPGVGYTFRPYSSLSEPESRAIASYFDQVRDTTGSGFAAGDDLHGQPEADALSYTLIPNASKTFAKNLRIRETSKLINKTAFEALKWSPIIQGNDQPQGGGPPCVPGALGDACAQIYAQTWGTVYDTINYTTTGALGDYFDSSIGLDADGIDNEMSFSHLDKNIVFEPQTEQLHVDGNKFLMFAHLAAIIDPALGAFDSTGRKGYVPNVRVKRTEKDFNLEAPPNTRAQDNEIGSGFSTAAGETIIPFEVKRTEPTGSTPGIYNGGLRADVRTANVAGVGSGLATLSIECRFCDDHPGVEPDEDEWVVVQEDFNQSPVYAQAGVTAAVNRPQAFNGEGTKVEWRARISGVSAPGPINLDVDFTSGPATTDGDAGGAEPPKLAGYDVANTDVFDALNASVPQGRDPFERVDPAKVIAGTESLTGLKSLVLADDPLPGYTGPFTGDVVAPTGPPTANQDFASAGGSVPGGGSGAPGTYEDFPFTIGANDGNKSLSVEVEWADGTNDWDLRLLRVEGGDETEVESSGNGPPSTEESLSVDRPAPGDYVIRVDNYAAQGSFTGRLRFTALPPGSDDTATGAYTVAQRDTWLAKLTEYVEGGGNLVLTDGALRALPSLAGLPGGSVSRQPVYAGQMTFAKAADEETLEDPLAKDVAQPGARFNSGKRRQTFEPVPVGFAIQDATGGDASLARQYDVDRAAFEAAGGRVAATSANDSPRSTVPVYSRVTLGEIPKGQGQIRVAGALLPQPTTEFDHPFGLSPHGLTYTGYIITCNLLGADCSVRSGASIDTGFGGGGSGGGGGGGQGGGPTGGGTAAPAGGVAGTKTTGGTTACASTAGFASSSVRPSGRGLSFRFKRRLSQPVTVEVFQTSKGRRIVRNKRVARFTNRTRSFKWKGAGARADGLYFVRYRIRTSAGRTDFRRHTLQRSKGRFRTRTAHYARASCGLLSSFKLDYPGFGGRTNRKLGIAYRLARAGTVTVTVSRKGSSRAIKRFKAARTAGGRTVRLSLRARGLKRGDYVVRLTAKAGATTARSALGSRRL